MGRPATISRDQILDAAVELLDAEGLKGLSMRRLGRVLGVEAMSLYRHVAGKEGLLDGLHERLLRRMAPVPRSGDWRQDLATHARAFRDLLRQHPAAVPLFASRPAVTPGSLAYLERGLTILTDAGLDPSESIFAFQALYEWVVGHAQFQGAGTNVEPEVDPERFPLTADALRLGYDADAGFEFGLGCLLDGIERRRCC